MAWMKPKTDWESSYDSSGNYTGDYFNFTDYNRIKNNLTELRNKAVLLYPEFSLSSMGADKAAGDYLYADEINALEDNLDAICKNTLPALGGVKKTYYENTATINYVELNRIEQCCLNLYNNLVNQAQGRPVLSFVLGTGGHF